MFAEISLSFILFIDWFVASSVLYVFSFHLNYRSRYVIGLFYNKRFLCMILKWLLSYIKFIDWFFICLDLHFLNSIIVGRMFVAIFTRSNICLFVKYSLPFFFIDWFIACFVLYIFSFHLNNCSSYAIGWFYNKWFLCMIVKWLLSYIQFIEWFFIYWVLYVVSLHLNYHR